MTPLRHRAIPELRPERDHRLARALAGHRPAQRIGLPGGEAGQRHRHLDHLLLVEDDAVRLRQHRLQQRMIVLRLDRQEAGPRSAAGARRRA